MFSIKIGNYIYKIELESICLALILFITLSAGTRWGFLYRYSAFFVLAGVSAIRIIKNRRINSCGVNKYYFFCLILLLINSFLSYSTKSSLYFFNIYSCIFIFLLSPVEENFWNKLYKPTMIIALILAISIPVSAVNPALFHKAFSFILGNDGSSFIKRAASGQYAGLAGEIGEAAVVLMYGIAVGWADLFTNGVDRKKAIKLAILYAGLMLTTKRTISVISIAIPLLFFLLQKQNVSKRIKTILLLACVALVGFVLLKTVPALNTVLERFSQLKDDTDMGGRSTLWMYSFLMFKMSPFLGMGYGAYNDFFNSNGGNYLLHREWNYYGHNCYLQALGEVGIVGIAFIFVPMIVAAIFGLIMFRDEIFEKYRFEVVFWSFIIILFLLYCYTGNGIYYPHQICMIVLSVYRLLTIHSLGKKM